MTYHNWARQCPTAESAVYRAVPRYRQIIPAGTLIHDPRSTREPRPTNRRVPRALHAVCAATMKV